MTTKKYYIRITDGAFVMPLVDAIGHKMIFTSKADANKWLREHSLRTVAIYEVIEEK